MKKIIDELTRQRQKIFRMYMDVTEDRVLELSQEYETDQNALSQLMELVLPYIPIQREQENFCEVFQRERYFSVPITWME